MKTMSSIFIIIGIVCLLYGIFVKLDILLREETISSESNKLDVDKQEIVSEEPIIWNDESEQFTRFTIGIKDWEELTKDDEVYNFTKRVNESALKKDYYSKDFRRAVYDSFHEETNKYLINKYNEGKPISIIDTNFPK